MWAGWETGWGWGAAGGKLGGGRVVFPRTVAVVAAVAVGFGHVECDGGGWGRVVVRLGWWRDRWGVRVP